LPLFALNHQNPELD